MAQVVFAARKRAQGGSGAANRLRAQGRVPAVIYGHAGKAQSIDLDALELSNSLRGISESTIVKIDVEGQGHDAFVKDTQRNIRDGKILHVDFYEVDNTRLLRARVRVHTQGNPQGVREGGVLELPVHDIEVECLPQSLPERIDVDISGLGVNQSIHVRDLPLGDGVRLITNADQVVALVKFAKEEAEAETGAEAAAGEAVAATGTPEAAAPAEAAKEAPAKA